MKELKASDIVRITNGRASFSTAGKWLKSVNPSLSVVLLLEYLSAENNGVHGWPSTADTCAKLNESVKKVGGIEAAAAIVNKRSASSMGKSKKSMTPIEFPKKAHDDIDAVKAVVDDAKSVMVEKIRESIPSLKKASEIPAKPVVKIESTAWDSLPEGKSVGCRYNGEMTIDDLNDTESYVEVGKSGYKVLRAWTEFSLAGVRFERKDFKKK